MERRGDQNRPPTISDRATERRRADARDDPAEAYPGILGATERRLDPTSLRVPTWSNGALAAGAAERHSAGSAQDRLSCRADEGPQTTSLSARPYIFLLSQDFHYEPLDALGHTMLPCCKRFG